MKRIRTKALKELEAKYFSPEEVEEIEKSVEAEIIEMNLRELRQLTGRTQEDVAQATQMRQPELSRVERRDDHLLSTLRRYVEALGGELEVVARIDGKSVKLRGV
jgi:predicted transcriptional regulator